MNDDDITTTIDTPAHLPPIQLLVPLCLSADDCGERHTWLEAYALMTITPQGTALQFDGEIHIGNRYVDDPAFVQHLADALDPAAVLAGFDLDTMIRELGRLPLDVEEPGPALEMLGKLNAMLEEHPPIDLDCNDDARSAVRRHAEANGLTLDVPAGQCNRHEIARAIADHAGAYVLALAEQFIPAALEMRLIGAWADWHLSHVPVLQPAPAEGMIQ